MVAMVSPRFTRSYLLVSTTHAVTLCRRSGTLSCLRTWPPDLADMAGTRPRVLTMSLSTVPPVDCKCAAAAAGPSLRLREPDRFALPPLRASRKEEWTSRGTTQEEERRRTTRRSITLSSSGRNKRDAVRSPGCARTERAADALPELPTRNLHMAHMGRMGVTLCQKRV